MSLHPTVDRFLSRWHHNLRDRPANDASLEAEKGVREALAGIGMPKLYDRVSMAAHKRPYPYAEAMAEVAAHIRAYHLPPAWATDLGRRRR